MDKAHILVVDDDVGMLSIFEAMLKDDYLVTLVEDGGAALNLISRGLKPDLILLDVFMPDVDGFTMCEELQSDSKINDIPIIFISGNTSSENEVKALELGAVDYITKPFHLSVVDHRIRTQLELLSHRNRLKELVTKRTEELTSSLAEVKNKENYLKGLINLAPIGIGLLKNGEITQTNEALIELTGYSQSDLVGMAFESFYSQHATYLKDFEKIDVMFAERKMAFLEAQLIKKCGTVTHFSLRFSPLDYARSDSEIIFTVMDITESKKYEAELEARFDKRTQELRMSNELLQLEIHERKCSENALIQSEIALEKQRAVLEESNVALKVLIRDADHERRKFEERIALNLQELVDPYLDKIKKSKIDERQRNYLSIIDENLKTIVSPLVKASISLCMKLTPAEIQIVSLIKQGKSSKEIADLLYLSQRTIDKHRSNIRKKIGIANSKVNLRSVLVSELSPVGAN